MCFHFSFIFQLLFLFLNFTHLHLILIYETYAIKISFMSTKKLLKFIKKDHYEIIKKKLLSTYFIIIKQFFVFYFILKLWNIFDIYKILKI